jgi:hypothetical protein
MTTEKQPTDLDQFTVPMLLTAVFDWAYNNDLDLYKNMDGTFEAFNCRNSVSQEQREEMRHKELFETNTPLYLLARAVEISDFQDTLKFKWTFLLNSNSTNRGHFSYDWKYSSDKPNPYSSLTPLIEARLSFLERNGLADWHKSEDHDKHRHYRQRLNTLQLNNGTFHFQLRFFVLNTGNVKSFDTIHVGSNDSDSYNAILQYILDKNICPDPHYAKLEIPDFANPDIYSPRYITSSARLGGFNYLVYLTASELQEIYKTKIKRAKLNYIEKATWAFINASSTDKETKFFLFIH